MYFAEAEILMGTPFGDDLFATFLDEFIPIPHDASNLTKANRASKRAEFSKLYFGGETMEGLHGTTYGAIQATGEYLDHYRPFRSQDTYLTRTMLSPPAEKVRSFRLIRELAGVGVTDS